MEGTDIVQESNKEDIIPAVHETSVTNVKLCKIQDRYKHDHLFFSHPVGWTDVQLGRLIPLDFLRMHCCVMECSSILLSNLRFPIMMNEWYHLNLPHTGSHGLTFCFEVKSC